MTKAHPPIAVSTSHGRERAAIGPRLPTTRLTRSIGVALAASGAALALGLVCCGPSAEGLPYLRDDHDALDGWSSTGISFDAGDGAIPDEPLEGWDTSGAGPLTGIFAVETVIQARVSVHLELRQLFRLRIVQRGTRVHQKTTLCAFKLPAVPNTATLVIPDRLMSLMQTQKSVEGEGDYLSNPEALAARYTPPPFLLVAGAHLANPATDPLPSMQNPAGSIDEDGDGQPGVTIGAQVLTCDNQWQALYVALRTSGTTNGVVQTPDVIVGSGDVHFDFSVLGYSNDCLSVAAQLNILIYPGSPFRAERVGAGEDVDRNGNVSCPEIVLNADRLFSDWSQPQSPQP